MRSLTAVVLTLFVAMILSLLPMPTWANWARPAWVLLVLLYWTIAMPSFVNVGFAWFAGLLLDLSTNTLLGEHALALVAVIYIANHLHLRINMYSIVQQCICVLIFTLIYQLIIFCVQGFIGELPRSPYYWLTSLTTMLLWPWLSLVLRDFAAWYRVAVTE